MYNFGSIPFFASNNNLVEKNPSGLPSCTVPPSLSGEPTPGRVISVNLGTWTNDPTRYSYDWYLDGVFVSTQSTYESSIKDVGKYIKCVVTAGNLIGKSSASTRSALIR